MFAVPIGLAIVAAIQSAPPRHRHPLSRPLLAWLHYRQPLARGWARYSVRLRAKVIKGEAHGYKRDHELPFDPGAHWVLRYWSSEHERLALLRKIEKEVRAAGWRLRLDSGWKGWDMEIYGSRYVKVQLTTATEIYAHNSMLTRVRVRLAMSKFCLVLFVASLMLAGLLVMHLWPFSRTALLIPLAWWAMYAVNRWRVSRPIFGLIDQAAEQAGFTPLAGRKPVPRPGVAAAPTTTPAAEPVAAG